MTTPRVSLIIVCWNRWQLTERLLQSLERFTDLSGTETILVDNGSEDQTSRASTAFPWLRVLTQEQNLGFSRGCNAGIRAAQEQSDILLLNNDVEILEPGWLEELQRCAYASAENGVVGARLTMPDGRLLHAGTRIDPDTCWGQQIGSLELELNQYGDDRIVQGVVFACAYIKRDVLDKVGLLSEEYESYFEDTDYCLRSSLQGFRTVCCGSVTLRHDQHGTTASDPDFRRRVFAASQSVFRRKWSKHLDRQYVTRTKWQSIASLPTGYSVVTRNLLPALDNEGVRVGYSYVYGPGTPLPVDEAASDDDHLFNVFRTRAKTVPAGTSVVFGQGDVFHRNDGRYRVGYTMLEVDGFPEEWVRQANSMDELWTPTEFNRQGMIRSGVKREIYVIPLGIDPDHFNPRIRRFENPRGDFVFLSNFEWGERKYPELLLKVFNQAFRRSDDAVLVCKISNRNRALNVRKQIQNLRLSELGGRIRFLYNRNVPQYQLASLYRSADCYVSAGRGEGWDLPLMEAMACGLPSIATDWGGHDGFVDDAICYPLRIRGTVQAVSFCPYYDGFSWAEPDAEHLRELLRHIWRNREEARGRGSKAAEVVRSRWTWHHTAQLIRRRLERIETG